ncbi:MAG: DUF3108 domain-containing protein [Calditrichaeota bacterium]|nr:MAG: DUF3108 domain-containing protein [Calditrichota bacterium]
MARVRWITMMVFILMSGWLTLRAEDTPKPVFQWKVGEELFYKVKYLFIKVGTLHFKVLEKTTYANRPVYHCWMHIKSASGVPLVDIDDFYESYIDENMYTHYFIADEKQGNHRLYTTYEMNYDSSFVRIHIEKRFPDDTVAVLDSLVSLPVKVQDGLSLLYYARAYCKTGQPGDVPVFAFNELKSTFINFTRELQELKVKGVEVKGYYLDGKMKFVGIAGVKEDFKGWFSEDPQSVPLHARMKAIVGSVKINLEWWRNWDGEAILGVDKNKLPEASAEEEEEEGAE